MQEIFERSKGNTPFDLPVPQGFRWVYPICCGEGSTQKPRTFVAEEGLLLWLVAGEGEAVLGGQSCGYLPGCVALAPPGMAMHVYPQERTGYRFLRLAYAGEQLAWASQGGFLFAPEQGSGIEEQLATLCRDAYEKRSLDIWEASARCHALLMRLCAASSPQAAVYSALVRDALALMRRAFAFLEGVDGLAEQLGVSKNHLIRQFTAQLGCSPGRYLQQIRLEHARQYLQNPDCTVELVAGLCGFASANYFCKVFRKVCGESPGQYRARHAGVVAEPAVDAQLYL